MIEEGLGNALIAVSKEIEQFLKILRNNGTFQILENGRFFDKKCKIAVLKNRQKYLGAGLLSHGAGLDALGAAGQLLQEGDGVTVLGATFTELLHWINELGFVLVFIIIVIGDKGRHLLLLLLVAGLKFQSNF